VKREANFVVKNAYDKKALFKELDEIMKKLV